MSSSPHYDRALRADLPTAIRLVREAQARLPLGDPTSTDLRFVTFEMTVAGLLAKLDGVTEADPSNEDKTIVLREIMCVECHRPIGRGVAHIDCEAPNLGLVSDGHDYRAGSVDSAVATVVRAMGLAEEQINAANAWIRSEDAAQLFNEQEDTESGLGAVASHVTAFLSMLATERNKP